MPEQRNLILAIVLSVTIIIAFQYFYELPRIKEAQRQPQQTGQMTEAAPQQTAPDAVAPSPPGVPASPEVARTQALATAERVAIEVATIETALQAGVPVYTGEFKIDWFYRQLASWRPDVIIVCACGQIFDARILELPRYGVYNFHPSDLAHGHGAGQPEQHRLPRGRGRAPNACRSGREPETS